MGGKRHAREDRLEAHVEGRRHRRERKSGGAVVRDLLEHEHEVLAVDVVSPAESPAAFLLADLTDFGQPSSAWRARIPSFTERPSQPYNERRSAKPS